MSSQPDPGPGSHPSQPPASAAVPEIEKLKDTNLPQNKDQDSNTRKDRQQEQKPLKTNVVKDQPFSEMQKSLLGNVDCLRFRNHLLEVVEELRIRRAVDAENEDKLKQLLGEKHQLENKYEDIQQNLKNLEQKESENALAFNKQLHDELTELNQEKAKLSSACECAEKELRSLKDEVRALQLCKYSLEKKLGEQDKKLQLHSCAQDTQLTQLAALDATRQSLIHRMTELSQQQDRLQENVKAAGELNRKLAYVNEHQNCVVRDCRGDIARLERELVEARIQLDTRPQEEESQRRMTEKKMAALRNQVKSQGRTIEDLKSTLKNSKQQIKESNQSLQAAQTLVERQVNCSNERQLQLDAARSHLAAVRDELSQSEKLCREKVEELKSQKELTAKETKEWTEKKTSLQTTLDDTRSELDKLQVEHGQLQESNLHWVQKHHDLSIKVEELQAELNKPCSDAECQVSPDTSDCSAQVQPEVTANDTQTAVIESLHKDVQTDAPQHCSAATQASCELSSVQTQTQLFLAPPGLPSSQASAACDASQVSSCTDTDTFKRKASPPEVSHSVSADVQSSQPTSTPQPSNESSESQAASRVKETHAKPDSTLREASAMDNSQPTPKLHLNEVESSSKFETVPNAVAKEEMKNRNSGTVDKPCELLSNDSDLKDLEACSVPSSQPTQSEMFNSQGESTTSLSATHSSKVNYAKTGGNVELSPYSRFTASLKSLADNPRITSPGSGDKRNEGPASKKLKLQTKSHAAKSPAGASSGQKKYSFQFVTGAQVNPPAALSAPVPLVRTTRSSLKNRTTEDASEEKSANAANNAGLTPRGILQEYNPEKGQRRSRRVRFSSTVDMSSPPQQKQGTQQEGLEAEAQDFESGEEPLFSDDDSTDIEMGSQVHRIENFLKQN